MRHGNISNQSSPIIAFNVDTLLFKEQKAQGLKERIKNSILGDDYVYSHKELNNEFIDNLREIWNRGNYSIYLITFQPNRDKIEQILDIKNVCYTKLLYQKVMTEFRQESINQYMFYFDIDENILSYLSYNGAVHYDKFFEKVGRHNGS